MSSKVSLADKIAGVLTAAPSQFDSDDEDLDTSNAKLGEFVDFEETDEAEEALLSKFRTVNVDLLADVDQRYAGKTGSRRELKEENSSDEFLESEKEEDINKSEDLSDESENELSDASMVSHEDESDVQEEDSNFQHMHKTNRSDQVKKGLCIRNQLSIWENLLELRIQMQKCLLSMNKMPQKDHFKEMSIQSEEFETKSKEVQKGVSNILDKLLTLQTLMVKKFPETKKLRKCAAKQENEDEEITSSSEDEQEEESDTEVIPTKKRKLTDYEEDISSFHADYKQYRNQVIENWNTKTRLSITKNSGQSHSVVSQIEHILGEKEKLIKKTQLKRSEFKILGQSEENQIIEEGIEVNGDQKQVLEEYNSEIFDDTDFYHQLLRELIEVKSADITDSVQLGRQWIQLQNLRSKMKRKIDTRATKGRKIRYAVHSKLVNFMAPMDNHSWTEEAKNELYSSLFGKIH
ncbi:protein AATF-like [Euwallacea fornicatus]|uniref:protein AATF-like n=1 Tax=Euwallacea fornicatus TaxID=995702 RepID=UPI00338E0ED5